MTDIFTEWVRNPTNTEIVAKLLIDEGLNIDKPKEFLTVYRVQPKVTGDEGRRALCYLGRYSGCEDIRISYNHRQYTGIDLFNSVSDLAKHGLEIVQNNDDHYLWVVIKKEKK